MFYVDFCEKKDSKIECSFYMNRSVFMESESASVSLIETRLRANGRPIVYWTYQYSTLVCYVDLVTKGFGQQITGGFRGLPISSIRIGPEDYTIIVSKTARSI